MHRPPTQPDYILSSKADLLSLLRRHSPQGGLPVKKLRESWTGAQQAIEDLEREGRVLVTRTGKTEMAEKDGQMKMVFLDDIGRERDPLDQGASPPSRRVSCALSTSTMCSKLTGRAPRRVQGPVALAQDARRRRPRPRAAARCVFLLLSLLLAAHR